MTEPKKRPILFSAPMVLAILRGEKNQTRRVVKMPKHFDWPGCASIHDAREVILADDKSEAAFLCGGDQGYELIKCPYGKPGDFLWPQWASRILLKITDVRVERVQEISEEDALAEGVGHGFTMNAGYPDYQHIKNGVCEVTHDDPRMSFASLWDSINAKRGFGWDANPYVWVIPFERVGP